jgi:hypothetical protein
MGGRCETVIVGSVAGPVFKTIGYVISSLSVLLLGFIAWDGAKDKPLLVVCLIAGMATSVAGMAFRWISFLKNEKASQGSATPSIRSVAPGEPKPTPAPDRHGSEEPRRTAR